MSKIRINDLARELEVKSREILDVLTTVGVTEKKTHSSSLEDHEAELVRKHLRGRADAASSSGKASLRAMHGEEEIKTKIDLSHISRPGDVLRAITQQKGAVEHPAARPPAKPPISAPAPTPTLASTSTLEAKP
ncbi:MAG: translation initiation factor IF-2 N-terminal domain-containing protein, partial [Terriglobales bacterium]